MKPRSKYQQHIVGASRTLQPLTDVQRNSAIRKAVPHLARRNSKGECLCFDCGCTWKVAKNNNAEHIVCPHCGTLLELDKTKRRNICIKDYFGVVAKHNGYQVIRIFLIKAYMRYGDKARYEIDEIFQRWIDRNGKCTLVGRKRNFSYYVDSWDLSSDMEIRREHYAHSIIPSCICGRMSVIPEIKRNGFKGNFYDLSPRMFFEAILTDSRMETLLKADQISLFVHFVKNGGIGLEALWNSIKICIRHHYTIKDATLWIDLISALEYCGKDLHSPKYICPDNIQRAHDHWVKKREEKQTRERVERERQRYLADLEQRKMDERDYKESKGRFFGIVITDGIICIKVLDSVQAFYEEGALLHHCVASNKYYNKAKSLILSATIDGKPIETIEISLDTLEILQCRGKHNQNTEYHERILSLMQANMNQVAKRLAA